MSFGIYDASVPVFVRSLTNMRAWLDKAAQEKDEAALIEARLHVTTAYAILRNAGVSLGKPDFLQHLGPPSPES